MASRMTLLAALVVGAAFAGCIAADQPDDEPTEAETLRWAFTGDLPLPLGQAARDYVESYVMGHPFRLNSPATAEHMATARDSLEELLVASNITVVRHDYGSGVNILGIIEGSSTPEQWVVLSAHYDTTQSTVYGAWDDGTGVAALLALAEVLPSWNLPFTVVLAFFDEEEQGLVGSQHFVQAYNADDSIDLVANINMDPPGLNWPCGDEQGAFPVKIIHDMAKVADANLTRYAWLHAAIEHGLGVAAVPADARDYTPGIPIAVVYFPFEIPGIGDDFGVRGTSDHANFNAVDIANVYIGGTPTSYAGESAAALTYPLHTPLDTLEAVEARCTQGSLAEGLHTTVTLVVHALAFMAETGVPQY